MKNKTIICLCLFNILLPISLFAQKSGMYIGKLDLYTAVMLHPSMIWFSPEKKAFRVSRDSINKSKIASENKSNIEERKKLESKLKIIKSRIKEEDQRYNNTIANLTHKYIDSLEKVGTATAELNKINFKKYSEEAYVAHQAKINSYYGEYTLYEDKISKIETIITDNYTSSEETERRLIEIINEIKSYSKRVADQKGIAIVLNSGYKRLINRKNKSFIVVPESSSFGSIFATQFPTSLLNDEAAVKGYYLGIESKINNWLDNGNSLLGDIESKAIFEEEIIVGGVDLTVEVLNSIYKAYKIDSNISKSIIGILKK